ncbi:MAG TPA: CaiB/BaiF CoA-transferase family protein [Burkholderiales bacterium]|jgi:formyl-CoA transferase|nr:CaiB/BaiF CoA-transferase family protein [Burkholderiales bacterium]
MRKPSSPSLKGIKVIELGTLIAGPFCSRVLAEFGAEVIKIEAPDGGDQLRQWRKMYGDTSLWWFAQARNKKSITVNLRVPEGQQIVHRLAVDADIVIENFRPGALEKWNIGWEQLSKISPRLIMVRLSGYGQSGPYRDRPGFGTVAEAMGGMRYVTGYADRPPVRLGISIGDSIAALYGVIGALMALHHRDVNGGRGQLVDVALYEAVFSMMESLVPEFDVLGFIRERAGNALPGIVPSNTYPTRDHKYVIIGANNDSIFKRMMTAIGRADLAADPALATNAGRVPRTAELDQAIADWTQQHALDHVLEVLEKAEVPSGKVYDAADILNDAHYLARGMIEQHKLPDGTAIKLPGIVPKLSDTPGATAWVGPALGAHNSEILRSLGYDEAQQRELKQRRVI